MVTPDKNWYNVLVLGRETPTKQHGRDTFNILYSHQSTLAGLSVERYRELMLTSETRSVQLV